MIVFAVPWTINTGHSGPLHRDHRLLWRGGTELNCHCEFQRLATYLRTSLNLEHPAGLEPAYIVLEERCLNPLGHGCIYKTFADDTVILRRWVPIPFTLHHRRHGFCELVSSSRQQNLVPEAGVEPATYRLSADCSNHTELFRRTLVRNHGIEPWASSL